MLQIHKKPLNSLGKTLVTGDKSIIPKVSVRRFTTGKDLNIHQLEHIHYSFCEKLMLILWTMFTKIVYFPDQEILPNSK